MTRKRTRPALTLIESMIAMTASAVIFLAALQAFRQGRLVQSQLDSRMAAAVAGYDLWRLLSTDVTGSYVLQGQGVPGRWIGLPDTMHFLSVQPAGRPLEVEYKLSKAPSASTGQVVRLARFCSGSTPVGEWDRVTVAWDVTTFELRFASQVSPSDPLTWTTEFSDNRTLPLAVEVHSVRTPPDAAPAPAPEEFRWVIPIRATKPADPAGGAR